MHKVVVGSINPVKVAATAAVLRDGWLETAKAFLDENPDLSADGLTVTCKAGRIQEVRICLTRDLEPRDCAPDVRRDCTLSDALFDPIR